jgi:putative transposase
MGVNMSVRSYTKIWLHLIWGTHNHEKSLPDRNLRKELSKYLCEYSIGKNIYMKTNYVNPEHIHAVIDLPTNITVEEVIHLYKGNSSYWVNNRVNYKFQWSKGYAAFSVSESNIDKVITYIANQQEHHRKKNFTEEYETFLKKYQPIINR